MRPRHAFTVIELLVVIAIIAVLVVLLLPARTSDEPGPGRRTVCLQNLKSIGLACAQYSDNSADRVPCGKPSVFLNATLMSNFLGSTKILVCPSSQKKPAVGFGDPKASDAANVSYTQHTGMTTGIVWQSDIDSVLFWDQGVAGNACGTNGGIGLSWATNSNHKGVGGNVLFNDGHARWHTKTPTNMPLGCLNP